MTTASARSDGPLDGVGISRNQCTNIKRTHDLSERINKEGCVV